MFNTPDGQSYVSLKDQATMLFSMIAGVDQPTLRLLFARNHKVGERLQRNLDMAREKFVVKEERKIRLGARHPWQDVEADEGDLRKSFTGDSDSNQAVQWEQWGGVVERGYPETLILTRLNPRKTNKRAPGPGPMRKREWLPFARKRLMGRNIVLHTDGARAYKLKVPGVIHDNIVHKKKLVMVKGKKTWVKPSFVKVVKHTLPDGKNLHVKAGTQVIDRVWRFLRASLFGNSASAGSRILHTRIRSAQWVYWNRGQDLWANTGAMLRAMRQ